MPWVMYEASVGGGIPFCGPGGVFPAPHNPTDFPALEHQATPTPTLIELHRLRECIPTGNVHSAIEYILEAVGL